MGVSMSTAQRWVERWELQQEHYALDRETRFTVIADVVEHLVGERERPLLLDLGCGPGSLSARLAERLPHAEIVAVDMDPFLLELGRTHRPDAARYVDAVMGAAGWADALGLERPVDAAVSTTALHYLPEPVLATVYGELARRLGADGAVVNGDHFPAEDPWRARLTAHLGHRFAQRSRSDGREDWESWWAAAAREQEFVDLLERRESRYAALEGADGTGDGLGVSRHVELLRKAGFSEAGLVWQYGDSGVLVARRA
ncbi:class I SAM-dependent methyltransferase [Streptomyces sp. NPDC005012]|uniref:class I SAM-dependent methyltransferase n=1 Tax=unclassified Streptomyces TaxID=2593676 RepID=UPI0033AFE270